MPKKVVVVASGETERLSLPRLIQDLQRRQLVESDIAVEVRIPRGNRDLDVDMAEKLALAAWYADYPKPAKFVILVDADAENPDEVLGPFRREIPGRLGAKITAPVLVACAQRHLEAWFFADAKGLRSFLGGTLGSVDHSKPDEIMNPKQHLKNLLGAERKYTSFVSESIAKGLNAQTIFGSSPSFKVFVEAVKNGDQTQKAPEQTG